MYLCSQELVPATAVFGDVYGTTETQGYITAAHRRVPVRSTGIVLNHFEYKVNTLSYNSIL